MYISDLLKVCACFKRVNVLTERLCQTIMGICKQMDHLEGVQVSFSAALCMPEGCGYLTERTPLLDQVSLCLG